MMYDGRMKFRDYLCTVTLVAGWFVFAHQTAFPAELNTRGDRMMAAYFAHQVQKIENRVRTEFESMSLEDWENAKDFRRKQLADMLGLDPEPPRTPLNAVFTGSVDHESFVVRRVYYESMPGLYVTGNLYVPRQMDSPAPAVIYVCGHANVVIDGIPHGNKTHYQHHPSWFASNGYVSLAIDTIQLGEIEGLHHGTYREGMWWWNSRGYTPAGVEAWNTIRAVDYLQSLDYVDGEAIGITGRSGGGAYSWWAAALDERIKVVAPVAGITDLRNHVIDGTVEGHCDCMFHVNTQQWDFAEVAALIAPRPLMILNTDRDSIFPLDGVHRIFSQTRKIYKLYGKESALGLVITPGGHKDTQELQLPAFKWFNQHLRNIAGDIPVITSKPFSPKQLKVFDEEFPIPANQRTSHIHDSFNLPRTAFNQPDTIQELTDSLDHHAFNAWPDSFPEPRLIKIQEVTNSSGWTLSASTLTTQPYIDLHVYKLSHAGAVHSSDMPATLLIPGESGMAALIQLLEPDVPGDGLSRESLDAIHLDHLKDVNPSLADLPRIDGLDPGREYYIFQPRGIGMSRLTQNARHVVQTRRRFMLLGQTLAGMQTWDIRVALAAVHKAVGQNRKVGIVVADELRLQAILAGVYSLDKLEYIQMAPFASAENDKDLPDILNLSRIVTITQLQSLASRYIKQVR